MQLLTPPLLCMQWSSIHGWSVTHCHASKSRTLYKLTYDMHDNLIAMEDRENILIVITDNMGTPHTVFNRKGDIIKELTIWNSVGRYQ